MSDFYCSQIAQQTGEMLAGTAVNANVWFLLQYDRPWQAKATTDNDLPPHIQEWLGQQLTAAGNGRLQFIRQHPTFAPLTFFIAIVDQHPPRLYEFQLTHYDDLLILDIPAIIAGDKAYEAYHRLAPLYLICTNGKRDRCCAKFGAAMFRAMQEAVGSAVWQTTHLGGHRFAATGMVFPQGDCYGHLSPDMLHDWTTAVAYHQILIPHYRGHAALSPVEQVADAHLRQQLNLTANDAVQVTAVRPQSDTEWQIELQAQSQTYRLHVTQTATPIFASCGTTQPKSKPQFTVHLT